MKNYSINVKDTTIVARTNNYKRIQEDLGHLKVADIRQSHVQKAINNLYDKGYAYKTILSSKNLLKGLLQKAIENDMILRNPCEGVILPIDYKEQIVPLSPEMEKKFFEAISGQRYAELFYILLYTGMRIGDDDDKIRLNQRKPSKYKGLSRFGPEKNLQRINKFMKERPIFYKNLIQMKENFRFYLRCFYCITKVVILQFNSEKQDRISS